MALSLTYWILAAYLVLGSVSIGYMFLRTGWPKVRALEAPYKIGWSMILGLAFAVVSVAGSLVIDAFFPTYLGSGELLLVIAAASFTATLPMLTIRRKFFAAKKARVHVPKEVVGAKLVAAKAVDKLMFDRAFIDASGLQLGKINELRKALERKRAEATAAPVPAVAPEVKAGEAKPAGAPEKPAGAPAEKQAEAPEWMREEEKVAEKPAPVVQTPQFLRAVFEQKISAATKKTAGEETKAKEEEKMKEEAEAAKISEAKATAEVKREKEAGEKKPEGQKKPVGQQKPAVAAAMPAAKAAAEEKKKPEQAPAARDFAQRQNAPIFAAAKIGKPLKKEGEVEIGWEASGAVEGKKEGAFAGEKKEKPAAAESEEKPAGVPKVALSEEEKKKKLQELKEAIKKAREAK